MTTTAVSTPTTRDDRSAFVRTLRELALSGLRRMYRPEAELFAFRLRRADPEPVLEGLSYRYTAIALVGLATVGDEVARDVLGGKAPGHLAARLVADLDRMDDVGERALTLWACRALGHEGAAAALDALRRAEPAVCACPTVELAWCLTALTLNGQVADAPTAHAVAERLMASFRPGADLFTHRPAGTPPQRLRGHVACFADLVYPIQALAHYHRATGSERAIDLARRCAERMVRMQGPAGQWWWHHDVRTGQVIEGYPVYSVHQDAMAPMALFDLADACGRDHRAAVERGLDWLYHAPEIDGSLVDRDAGVIWRKVARRERGKLTRTVRALATCVHPALRPPSLFPPKAIDWESRPYHMGWILYAWRNQG
ncbi:MAG: hypothetical protein GX591_16210 [Planctomycetes bacterium]|nr:hypothetical protein [Planctomycetota bacterium]